jgi:uncharacterized protein YuzE
MKVRYDEADILIFILGDGFPANAISEPGGVIVSYDESERPLSIEFLNASQCQLLDPQELKLTILTN